MHYLSTRGGRDKERKSFRDILLAGLAADGGLYMPDSIPRFSPAELGKMRGMNYRGLAFEILSRFMDDIPAQDLHRLIDKTYTVQTFGSYDITPVRTLERGLHILELSNGPTFAFKDIALQLLGNLFEYALAKSGQVLKILGATSGDTGSSWEYAARGKKGIKTFILSPLGKMSQFQTAQMYSLTDPSIFNIAVRGVFDDCQDMVKAVSADAEFKNKYKIGTVNSINWARIAAQIVYYFKGYFAVTKSNSEYVDFSVPSGNFGDAEAGFIARMMGLPIRRIIVATNENDVLHEFFRTGRYRVRKGAEVHATSSPSMDISKSSNFERFIWELVGRDGVLVKMLWGQLDREGEFSLSNEYLNRIPSTGFLSGTSTHANRIEVIRRVWRDYGVVIDPHTADGVKVGLEHREGGVPLICLETALPTKFADTIREAIGREPERPAGYENLESLPQRFEVMDPDVNAVKKFIAANA
ncbi:MAG: threonine synthase [bacterium]|nr:threonine synthase [bacterium]